jgi:hypothetical protein
MALPEGLQEEQIRKAVAALLKHIAKQQAKANDLLEEDELLYLVRSCFVPGWVPFYCQRIKTSAGRNPAGHRAEEDAAGAAQGQAAARAAAALPLRLRGRRAVPAGQGPQG